MQGAKVLITGPTGQVAVPIAKALAADNEVWGIARFTNAAAREDLEQAGVRCEKVNLAKGEFGGLPNDFDYVLNLAVAKSGDWDKDLGANAESVGLLMTRYKTAKAFLHCSSTAVYAPGDGAGLVETDPLGDNNHTQMMPNYILSKVAAEAVALTCGGIDRAAVHHAGRHHPAARPCDERSGGPSPDRKATSRSSPGRPPAS